MASILGTTAGQSESLVADCAVIPSEGGRLSFTVAAVSLDRGMVMEPSWSACPC